MLPYNVVKISLYYGHISTIVVGDQFYCRGYTKYSFSTSTIKLKIHCINLDSQEKKLFSGQGAGHIL